MSTVDIVVLASGRGSNLSAIFEAIDAGRCDARVVGLVSDKPGAGALALAEARGVPTRVVPLPRGADRDAWNVTLADAVSDLSAQRDVLLVLAGFMRILGRPLLERFPGRLINVHPSLLPSFTGHDAPRQAVAAGVRLTGCTVHVVDDGVDTGPILAQAAVPVLPTDDADALHARIQVAEHALLPTVIHWVAQGLLTLAPPTLTQAPCAAGYYTAPRFDDPA
ncbi:MAG: phosphoribosylglycinamide formyltransferase [Sandaracinaceae bacterium]|nr:phosphoribosylglycinamide formyltransferase [Myxococcales bacterium]MCB9658524.1 phosphoribosylglycinamide formyltransferase [Sandaracinaceae bacterium]